MNGRRKYAIMLFAVAAIMLLISACSQVTVSGPGVGSAATATPSSLTSLQVLQNSSNAMKQLKSSHIDVQLANNFLANGATPTPAPGASVASTHPAGTPNTLNLNIKGTGDQALPNQEQMHLTINQGINVSEIVQGDQVYVQNANGQWYVMSQGALQKTYGNLFSGVNIDPNALLALVQNSKITDHGTQSLNGQNLRHITADLDKQGLRQLLTESPQLQSFFGQQNINNVVDHATQFLASIDVWIDESQFYVHRTQLQLNLVADTSTVGNGAPSSVSEKLNTIVDLSKFNAPVTITPPSGAIPTTNPGAIFGFGKP